MKILTISGSSRAGSSNSRLLKSLAAIHTSIEWIHSDLSGQLPLFRAGLDQNPLPEIVKAWRSQVEESDGIVICTPEYLHNLPAIIKNAMEWLTTSGEMDGKKVLAMTLTPYEPRGEKAMQSLLWTLTALNARIIVSLPLYQNELQYSAKMEIEGPARLILEEAIQLF